jgi:hypothetical protein
MQNISDTTLVNKTRKYYDVHPDHDMRLNVDIAKNKLYQEIFTCEPVLRFIKCEYGIVAIFDEEVFMN